MNKALTLIGVFFIVAGFVGGVLLTIELVFIAFLGIAFALIGVAIGPDRSIKRTLGVEPTVYCTNCGSSIKKDANFCPYCRKKV